MKVLMVNRENAFSLLGGDTIQMIKTKESLEKLGVKVDVSLGTKDTNYYKNYDIVHIFNVQTEKFSNKEAKKIKLANTPLVVSPIWWDFEEDLINNTQNYGKKMLFISKLIGIKNAKYLKSLKLKLKYKKINEILDISSYILPNSKMEIESLNRCFFYDNSKNFVIYNGISEEFVKVSENNVKRKYALQVGRIEPAKNTLLTIKACNELKIPLKLVGRKVDQDYYEKCLIESENGNVEFLDSQEHEKLIGIYTEAKVHILPSFRETPGLVSLEAGVLGCNIVSTNIGSAEEYFKTMVSYCNPNDFNSIKHAIHTEWNKQNDNVLRHHIINNFTWDIAAENTLKIYKKLIR